MKKLFISLCVLAAVSFTACGGSAKTEVKEEVIPATEVVAPAADSNDLVDQYSVILDKYIDVVAKVKKGDTAAMSEMTTIGEEMSKFVQDNADALSKLSEGDQKKFQELAEKAAKAMQ